MKKFSKFLFLFALAFTFVLVGCSAGLSMPTQNARVYGNGGSVVQKGEYIYFANAFTPHSSLSDGSVKTSDSQFGIYRTKLTSENNAEIGFDENGFAKNVELVSSKLAGFESLGMYIVGDYLFFASPNTQKTSSNQNRYDLVTFFSIKLDGTNFKELYTTFSGESTLPAALAKVEWKIYTAENQNYLVTVEGSKIIRHTINGNSLQAKTVLADDVNKTILPKEIATDFDKDIYYVANFSQEDTDNGATGTILKSVNLVSKETVVLSSVYGETIEVVANSNSRMFYTVKSSNNTKEGLYVLGQTTSALKIASTTSRTSLMFMGEGKPLVFVSGSKVYVQNLVRNNMPEVANFDFEVLIDSSATILFVDGDYVYYTNGSALMRISYQTKQPQTIISAEFDASNVDFDGNYVYAFKTLENAESSVKYLHRVKVLTVETSEEASFDVVGFVLEADKKAVIEANKNEEDK